MQKGAISFGRRGSGSSSMKQAVFGKGKSAGLPGGSRKGQTARPTSSDPAPHGAYGKAHSHESSYTDPYHSKMRSR